MLRALPLFAAVILIALQAAHAEPGHPALQSPEAFLAEIASKKWECSFTNYPELRFQADKIEILASDGKVTSTINRVTQVEPGIIRADFTKGVQLFVFGDDLQSFVILSMEDISEFEVVGATAAVTLPSASAAPLEIKYLDNPFWKGSRLHADKFEVLDESGKVFATNRAFPFNAQVQGLVLPENRFGGVALSRRSPRGWYLSGKNLGTGVRTDKSGYFRTFLSSKITGFPLRSAHFSYALLNAGMPELASAQEEFAVRLVAKTYGDTSSQVGEAWNQMGTLRGYARSYAKAPEYHASALEHVRKHLSTDTAKILEYATDLANSQSDAGNFAGAKEALASAYSLLPPPGGDFRSTYLFHQALGTAEFGLRNYPKAAQLFQENAKRAQDAKMTGNVVESLLYLIPSQLAQNQTAPAQASLKQCMEVQDQRSKANPTYNYDTWKIAFACVALGLNQEAVKYAPTNSRRNWVAYEEYGRMVSLFHGGDPAAAQSLAKEFVGRFANIQEINVRNDIDPIAVKLTQAIADLSPASTAALDQIWLQQVESLRNRPLKNYIFARVMVATLAKLKSGKL